MTESVTAFPRFANPPVVELALSVQFAPLTALRVAHFGLLWAKLQDRFPKTQEHPAIERTVEDADPRVASGLSVRVELTDAPPVPRVWFLNEQETELIQVQRDRLIVNWRKGSTSEQYPLFAQVHELFEFTYQTLEEFVQEQRLGRIVPDQCEVTYVDHITGRNVWSHHGQLDRVFTVWSSPPGEYLEDEPESAGITLRYIIRTPGGEQAGRLHIQSQPAYRRSDGEPIILLETTARGRPMGDGLDGVRRFFALGHEWSTRAFLALMSPPMQQAWSVTNG